MPVVLLSRTLDGRAVAAVLEAARHAAEAERHRDAAERLLAYARNVSLPAAEYLDDLPDVLSADLLRTVADALEG